VERETSDHDLLIAYAKDGSDVAFTELVQRHAHAVYASALRQTANPSLAEEVTQVVFILLARKAGSLKPGIVVAGWLFRATQFTAKDIMKAERRRLHRETTAFEVAADELTPVESADEQAWSGVSTKLDACLAQLSESDRHAVLLRFFENRSLAEVGTSLGVAEDAARKRVRRALDRLQLLLEKAGAPIGQGGMESLLDQFAAPKAPQHVLGAAVGAGVMAHLTQKSVLDAAVGRLARHLLWQQWKPWLAAAALAGGLTTTAAFSYHHFAVPNRMVSKSLDDYRPAGFPDANKVHNFVRDLQKATGSEDKESLAALVRYPLPVNRHDGTVLIQNATEFSAKFEDLFAGRPSKVILKCPPNGLYCDNRGIMIGAGEIWLGPDRTDATDPQPRIIALNLDR
jgi:RNA polymerase sigma factor (sigma-70 family)